MNNLVRGISLTSVLALAVGCAATAPVDQRVQANPESSAFNQALTSQYVQLAEFENQEMLDALDGEHYERKAKLAASDKTPAPDKVGSRRLPKEHVGELKKAHAELTAALDENVRELYPADAAAAQASYDCWLEQQEEDFQPQHIARCKNGFQTAMRTIAEKQRVAQATRSRQADVRSVAGDEKFVYFDFNKYTIDPNEQSKLDSVAAALKSSNKDYKVNAFGYADRAGPESYNKTLSMRRAQAVKAALVARGVPASKIITAALGENNPKVPTGDGVREAENRRVNIEIR